ncbi:MAG: DNA polymerase IV [Gammaproteobacteria bacterium]
MSAGSPAGAGPRRIAHVDMDAFYASVEQRDRPELRGLPVLVGGTGGRGVVAAASYEARAFGIHSAMPMAEARRRCPEVVCIHPRMGHYQDVSRTLFQVLREFTPEVEGLSLDEAFLDISASINLFGAPAAIGRRIKERVREETGLAASVGIGPNKLVAKIASDLDKPDGLCILLGDDIRAGLDPLPAGRIGGIGPRTVERLAAHGLTTLRDLRMAPEQVLDQVFGRYAARMRDRARGLDDRPVCAHRADQSISAEDTFERDIGDRRLLHQELGRLCDRVGQRLQRKTLQGAVVAIKLRRNDFSTFSRQRRVSPPLGEAAAMLRIASELLDTWLAENPGARLRLLGVGVSGLSPANQLGLFSQGPDGGDLDQTLASIRERFGDHAVARGRTRPRD